MDNLKTASHPAAAALIRSNFSGEVAFDEVLRRLYATDASEYQEMPFGVAWPADDRDVRELILWANQYSVALIPRTAGTSLAGQCVGSGMVVDFSRHFTKILTIDQESRRVCVQPGVIRDELNKALAEYKLFFGPETSTANRAMMGGMVGNNSCGSNSIIYGSTRDHLVRVSGFLSDGSKVTFQSLTNTEFAEKCVGSTLEAKIYRAVRDILLPEENRREIEAQFPLASISRRNTGYALDLLMQSEVFDSLSTESFNFCRLIAGSEGTLFVATEIELSCDPLPPKFQAILCGHFYSIDEALQANLEALKFGPSACELIDRHILECSKQNLELSRNADFIVGDPGAILVVELRRETREELETALNELKLGLESNGMGYAYPILRGADSGKVWDLRRAGQAVMNNGLGDDKPREVAEDTAVAVESLPAYIREFDLLMQNHGIRCVYYGHAATGELHMRPIFSLHSEAGQKLFRTVGEETAALVKKYRGSLSGEHGDGRLRGEFLQFMVGDKCYEMMRSIKQTFDPRNLLNPGKILDAPPMDGWLRHQADHHVDEWETYFDWSEAGGMLQAAEKCNGAGACRKTEISGGTMCPSYMATRREEDVTRGRANLLRQLMTEQGKKALESDKIHDVLDLCLSCKGCKSECPSNVDLAKLKAEFLQSYHEAHGVPLRSRLISRFAQVSRWTSLAPWLWNGVFGRPTLRRLANALVGFHPDRSIPLLPRQTLRSWFRTHKPDVRAGESGQVFLLADEFTNFQDVQVGISAVQLLEKLGYQVIIPDHAETGRAALSKGILGDARKYAESNVRDLFPIVSDQHPLIGLEPSALLTFRDEFPDLLRGKEQEQARALAKNCLLLEEFFVREYDAGRISKNAFREGKQIIRLHGHCHQKALVGLLPTIRALEMVPGHDVRLIPSGCCGMAGSFGYEREHYDLSQQIGRLVLFPTINAEPESSILCASGTSCRHQIHDGTARRALHPAEILLQRLAI